MRDTVSPDAPTKRVDSARVRSNHILVADNDSERRSLIAYSLRLSGYQVTECRNANEVAVYLGSRRWCAVIADMRMEDFDFVREPVLQAAASGAVYLLNARAAGEAPTRTQSHRSVHLFAENDALFEVLAELIETNGINQR